MIAANYTTHLYCDCDNCLGNTRCEQAEYIGESLAETARAARKKGWRISRDRTRCFSPKCKITRTKAA